MSTRLSTCDTLGTRITLSAPAATVVRGQRITLTATLRTQSSTSLGAVSGIRLNGRSVQLKRRPVNSTGSWTVSWMSPTSSPGVYSLSLTPSQSYEYRAVFPHPEDEGLAKSRSEDVVVRVVGVCVGSCPNEEDPT